MTILWENQDPDSGFSEQTISCNTSEYKAFLLVIRSENTSENYYESIIANIKGFPMDVYGCADSLWYNRIARVTDNGLLFEGNGYRAYSGSSFISSPNYAIPLKVYGIR